MTDVEEYVKKVLDGTLSGSALGELQEKGTITKGERRSIMKKVVKTRGRDADLNSSQKGGTDPSSAKGSVAPTRSSNKRKEMDGAGGDSGEDDDGEDKKEADDQKDGTGANNAESTAMTSKQKKNAIKLLNKELNACALKKQLNEAKKKVRAALKKELVLDVHSYTNLINCYARCGDVQGAKQTMEGMIQEGVSPNVVAWTALLKGCCDNGDLHSGRSIFLHDMLQLAHNEPPRPQVKKVKKGEKKAVDTSLYPNERSLATLLRGCQRVGAVSVGVECFRTWYELASQQQRASGGGHDEEGKGGGSGDSASLYVVSMCAQKLAMEDASAIAESLLGLRALAVPTNEMATLEQAGAALCISRGYAVMGKAYLARTWAKISSTCAKQSKSSSLLKAMQNHGKASAPAPKGGASSSSSSAGAHLYQAHQRVEIEAELSAMAPYLASVFNKPGTHEAALSDQLSKFLVVGHDGRGDLHDAVVRGPAVNKGANKDAKAGGNVLTAKQLFQALREKCGLAQEREQGGAEAGDVFTEEFCAGIEQRMQRCVTSEGLIEFPKVFSSPSSSAYSPPSERPLKLEIGSGAGEWAVAQAAADRGAADWVALELRCDRAYQIFCRQLFSAAAAEAQTGGWSRGGGSDARAGSNLSVIAGDAGKIMHDNIGDNTVSAVFVNHPEPPERSMLVDKRAGAGKSSSKVQGKHMLTDAFFVNCIRILKDEGSISIVTDSLPYAKLLTELVSDLPVQEGSYFESVDAGDDSDEDDDKDLGHGVSVEKVEMRRKNAKDGPVVLWRGEPGPSCGHSIIASSYFDRMWDKGNKKRRWFLYLRKKSST